MSEADIIKEIARLRNSDQVRAGDVLAKEGMLDRVARHPYPEVVAFEGDATCAFADGEDYQGTVHIRFDGQDLTASIQRTLEGPVGTPITVTPNRNAARIVPAGDGWVLKKALIDERDVHFESDAVTSRAEIVDSLLAHDLNVTHRAGDPAFARVVYAGGNFEGFPHESYRVKDGIGCLEHDTFRTSVFGRAARIRSVSDGRSESHKVFSVTFEDPTVDALSLRALWLTLNFFVGPQLKQLIYQTFDHHGNILTSSIPNGTPYTLGGTPVLRTGGPLGEHLAAQLPTILEKVRDELASGFPWHVGFRHLHESYTPLLESAVKNLVVALDSLIEATIGDIGKARFIPKGEYKALIAPMIETFTAVSLEKAFDSEFPTHMEEVLLRENHRGTSEKRRMFWKSVAIDATPYEDVLGYRDSALHTGHVLDYLAAIDYDEFWKDVARLRTIVNRAFLRKLTYAGPMYEYSSGSLIDASTGRPWEA